MNYLKKIRKNFLFNLALAPAVSLILTEITLRVFENHTLLPIDFYLIFFIATYVMLMVLILIFTYE